MALGKSALRGAVASGGGGSSVFVSEAFAGSNGTALTSRAGEIGATWTKKVGGFYGQDMVIHNGRAYGGGNYGVVFASGTPATAEHDVEADFTFFTDPSVERIDICAGVDPSADTHYAAGYAPNGSTWYLLKRVAGSQTILDSVGAALTTGHAKLQRRSTGVKLFVDGVQILTSNDDEITAAGRVGMAFGLNDTSGLHIDNFVATNA